MKNVGVLGLGRSGLAIAKSVKSRGDHPIVFDQKTQEALSNSPLLEEALSLGIELRLAHNGKFDVSEVDVIVTSPGVPKTHPGLQEAASNEARVIGEIEYAWEISKCPIIAITGTNGKSTTTVMATLALQAAGIDAVLCGNIYGSGFQELPLTEAAAASSPSQILVAEISSFQLEWIEKFRPKVATITNIADDHLNRYADFTDYASTKRRMFENMSEGDTAVARVGDQLVDPQSTKIRTLWFGEIGSDAWIEGSILHLLGQTFDISDFKLAEPHNLLNAMTALLLASAVVPDQSKLEAMVTALSQFSGIRYRMEKLGEKDGVLIINNSMCTNPEAVVASSKGVPRRQHLIIGGVNKDMSYAPLKDYLSRTDHIAYLYGTDSHEIQRQLQADWPVFSTMAEAFWAAVKEAGPGEAIMLAPGAASLDQFADFRDRGDQFTALATEWMSS